MATMYPRCRQDLLEEAKEQNHNEECIVDKSEIRNVV